MRLPEANFEEDDAEESAVKVVRTNLTEWPNEPSLEDLKQDYTDAQSDHDNHVTKVGIWLDNLNIEGKAKRKKKKGRSSIVPKLIRKQAEWRYAALSEPFLSTEDVFNIDPVTAEDKAAAIQNSLVLNNQFNTKIQKVKFFDEYIRAAVDEGTVITRVGWDFQEREEPVMVPDFQMAPVQDQQKAQMIMQAMQAMQQGGPQAMQQMPPDLQQAAQMSMQAGMPVEQIQVGEHEEMQMKTVVNKPTIEVCKYTDVIIDPTCQGDLSKAGFVIYRFETSKAELERAGIYHNLDRISIDENSVLGASDDMVSDDDEISFTFNDEPRKKIYAYEYWGFWDINSTGMVEPFVATWVGNTKIRMEENPYPDQKVPFVSVQYLPVRKKIHGEPDGELLEDNQKIIGAVTRGMIDIMGRSANGQIGSRKDALDTTNKRKHDAGMDYEFNQSIQDPRSAFFMHTFPEIPRSAEFILGQQNAEAESLTGVKAFNSGITGAALGDNATGIRSALDATSKRELGILRRLAEGIKQIGRKMIAMNAEFLEEGEVVRVTNDEFVPIRVDDLAGNFDLSLSISTAEADNDKAKELAFMLQTMGPNQDAELTKMIQVDIARLRKMPALAKRIEDYKPQPDPMQVKKVQLEIALLEAQVQTEKSKGPENQANAILDQAKAITEQAKARQLGSDADIKDLEFVEQETGTNHVRDMDKATAQANANRLMKADEHVYKMAEEAAKPKPAKASV